MNTMPLPVPDVDLHRDVVEDLSQGSLGCYRGHGPLQRRGAHADRLGPVFRALHHRPQTRRVAIAGIAPLPGGEWLKQIARNLSDADDGFLNGAHYLIHDRDPPVHSGVQGASQVLWRGDSEASGAKPRFVCLRGAIRSLSQIRVPGPDHPPGRAPPSENREGIHGALTTPSSITRVSTTS